MHRQPNWRSSVGINPRMPPTGDGKRCDTCWTLDHRAATARAVAAVCGAANAPGALSAGKWRLATSETPVSLKSTAARSAGSWQTPSAADGNVRYAAPRDAGRNRRPSQRIAG